MKHGLGFASLLDFLVSVLVLFDFLLRGVILRPHLVDLLSRDRQCRGVVAQTRPRATLAAFGWLVRMASSVNHWALYGLMPASGYAYSAAGGYALEYFWLFDLPRLVRDSKALSSLGEGLHGFIAVIASVAVTLHVVAVLSHELVMRDATLSRMGAAGGTTTAAGVARISESDIGG